MDILGLSAFYHDSAACLVRDGEVLAAAQEERFTRRKHDASFPENAVAYCVKEGGGRPVDAVIFYDKPLLKFERLLCTYLACAPRGAASFRKAMPAWLKEKLHLRDALRERLGFEGTIHFAEHHESHAASAFYPSPFEEAAVLTMDGVGEWATASYGVGRGRELTLLAEQRFPHSLGLLYSAFTYYLGFKVNSGEYKVMGLAPYGTPRFRGLIEEHLLDLRPDGSLRLDLSFFDFAAGLKMTSERFDELFGGPPRAPESELSRRDMDLAASIQAVTEEAMLRMARHVRQETGQSRLCLAGGVALNCVGNGRILREAGFDAVWAQPAAGDAGGALGAALLYWHQVAAKDRTPKPRDAQKASLLGPAFSDAEIEGFLRQNGIPHKAVSEDEVAEEVAGLLGQGDIVGWFQGRMEFGPRALGARSILADPRDPAMRDTLNAKIKLRESFRPFAPIVRAERATECFELDGESPYMMFTAKVRGDAWSAVTHVDGSARLQTVAREDHPRLHALLRAFERRAGCPVLVNTSLNVRGEPIVCTPEDAYRCFMRTDMDALVLGRFILDKRAQPAAAREQARSQEVALD